MMNLNPIVKNPRDSRLCVPAIQNTITVNIDPHKSPDPDLLSLFGPSILPVSVHKIFLLPLSCSLGAIRESMFQRIKMFNFKGRWECRLVVHFIVIITIVPLLVDVMSKDIYNALLKHRSMVMITIALIVFGIVNRFFIEVHHHFKDVLSLLALSWPASQPPELSGLREPLVLQVLPEPLVTGSPGPQVKGRPYSPVIYPEVWNMVDCYASSYVNERWGFEEVVEFVMARIHTKEPVPDVEAAILSRLTLTGSKVLLRRLEIGPQTGNFEIDKLSSEISEAMRRAREIDEDCTLQLGSFAILKYKDGGLEWWRLQKEWVPIISRVCRSWNLLDFLKGQSAKWSIRGFNLQSATLKVSTTDESETLNVIHHYKKKSGEDVLLCGEPQLVRHAAPTFKKTVYIYALNSVEVEDGMTFDVQSNPTNGLGAYWVSGAHCLRNSRGRWTLIIMACTAIMIPVLTMNITQGRHDGPTPKATSVSAHHHFQHSGSIINVGTTFEENSIVSLFLHEFPFFFLTFMCAMLISIANSTLRRLIDDRPLGPQTRSAAEDCCSSPILTSAVQDENELMLQDVSSEGQEEVEGWRS